MHGLPMQGKCWRFALVLAVGIAIGIAWMLASPAAYLALAEHISWRMHWPSLVQTQFEKTATLLHLRGDALVRPGDTLIFGDSHLQSIPASALHGAVNYSIGGEPAARLASRIANYPSVSRAGAIIVLSGRNDLAAGSTPEAIAAAIATILAQIPATPRIVLLAVPPAAESAAGVVARREVNRRLELLCSERKTCHFVASENLADPQGRLLPAFDAGDGIHLNLAGYEKPLSPISAALAAAVDAPGKIE